MEIRINSIGVVSDRAQALPETAKGFKPKCGWPEFLERVRLIKRQREAPLRGIAAIPNTKSLLTDTK